MAARRREAHEGNARSAAVDADKGSASRRLRIHRHGGRRVVGDVDAQADEETLLRAAYNLSSDAQIPEEVAAEAIAEESETGQVSGEGS